MKPTDKLTGDDATAAEMLRVLGGLICTGCGAKLDRSTIKSKKFRCMGCGQGHCPFCERSPTDACRHRIAYHETLQLGPLVQVRDFPDVMDADYEIPWLPVKPPFLLAFPQEEQRAAFGTAADLIEELCGPTLLYKNTSHALFFDLLRQVAGDGEVVSGNPTSVYFFARDPDATREEARQMLRDLEAGFRRLAASPPPYCPFLERVLPLARRDRLYEMDDEFGEYGYLCFAPGPVPRLAYAMWNKIVLWSLDRNLPPLRMTLPAPGSLMSIRFTSDGARLAGRTFNDLSKVEPGEPTGTTWLWDCESGRFLGKKRSRSSFDRADHPALQPPDKRHWPPLGGSLHGGETLLTVKAGIIRLAPVKSRGLRRKNLPETCIRLRGGFAPVAIAPDGETFAVIHGSQDGAQLLLFRVPREAVHGGARTVHEEAG